ncbi:uncharacterized protein FIBRA_06660 [Fibroporia radiculosa]|uniref:F-box domain-containing protein n=1 Tax=Fibroporia radiculosa TaxID=599839 RepID=J4GT66_9APHY|nr:uncharacterized protein FIBRA_06660 [Fibroporia radiculosa]CCM04480.1 predicted protein [Fibroporia radiculosa]
MFSASNARMQRTSSTPLRRLSSSSSDPTLSTLAVHAVCFLILAENIPGEAQISSSNRDVSVPCRYAVARPSLTLLLSLLNRVLASYLSTNSSPLSMASSSLFHSHYTTSSEAERTPRFTSLYSSVLGSPFLTTSDLPPDANYPSTSASNRGSLGTLLIRADDELEQVDGAFASVPRAYTVTRPPSPSPSFQTDTFSIINWNPDTLPSPYGTPDDSTPRCIPSGGRRTIAGYHSSSTPHFPSFSGPSSPSPLKPSRSLTLGILPRLWDALREGSPGKKGKRRPGLPPTSSWATAFIDEDGQEIIDWLNMPPLDGEEGELIDDEACYIDATRVTGTDIISHLPTEIALYVLSFLDLPAVLSCLRVSRTWNCLSQDNSVWRSLFEQRRVDGWAVDLKRARHAPSTSSGSLTASGTLVPAPLEVDWSKIYWTRTELDRRWSGGVRTGIIAEPNPDQPLPESIKAFEPKLRRMSGHMDRSVSLPPLFKRLIDYKITMISVYCLEFDSSRIITGSRDRTIKVWSLKTGECLASFKGHRGSVLCLKFDQDWDLNDEDGDGEHQYNEETGERPWKWGFMVSGSSDCSICVWALGAREREGAEAGEDKEVTAEITTILRGHSGGVLDLRIDSRWIVSCSKDALIRVWDRNNLRLHCTFRGHEGPVNAVGLQNNQVVSASGDGKMMLWDILSGECVRTFEGHDRGLACIEFKDDLIVSGSNDCKIKVWSASTGACLRTLGGHDLLVRALAFDPPSGRLVSASYDKTVKVWDLRTGRMVREFRGCHVSQIFDVKFDHGRIVSTSHDQQIVVLDFSEGLDVSLFV